MDVFLVELVAPMQHSYSVMEREEGTYCPSLPLVLNNNPASLLVFDLINFEQNREHLAALNLQPIKAQGVIITLT